MSERIVMRTGEALVAEGPPGTAAEPEIIIGELDGPVGTAKRWSASFDADPIVCYRRRTRELRVSQQFACAEELGNWVGKYSLNEHVILAAGVYSAKWQLQSDGKWLIQTEVFTTQRSKVI